MSGQTIAIRSIALAAPLVVCGVSIGVLASAARASDCLTAPNSDAPKGSHWYYHTDRAKGRKCWYLRALHRPAQHAAAPGTSARAPTTHTGAVEKPATASAASLRQLKAQPESTSNATTNEPVRQRIQGQSTALSASDTPAPQASAWSQPSAQAPASAPAAAIVWPDPPAIVTVTVQKPNSVPSNTRPDTVPASVDARASHESEGAARGGAVTIRADMTSASPAGTLVETSLVIVLGLIMGGLLYRLVMKISAVRGPRIIIDHSESDWIDDWREQPHGFVNEREEFIDDLHLSIVPAGGDYGTSRSLRADDKWQSNAVRKGRASRITEQVIERENTLVQLIQDIEQMLQSAKGA